MPNPLPGHPLLPASLTPSALSPEALIDLLGLKPHPEGGHFAEVFRDHVTGADGRSASTAIYFLLKAGEASRWHTVDAAEIWHFYAGDPLELTCHAKATPRTTQVLGTDFMSGQRPQVAVPAHAWQMARPLGAWSLVGCTVAPGFDFRGFTLAAPGFEPFETKSW
jgi:uncharacterized protein